MKPACTPQRRSAVWFRPAAACRVALMALLLGVVAPGLPALATEAASIATTEGAGEREQIATRRSAIEADFLAAQAACAQRFAVTACVDAARDARRAALAPLRQRELALDAAVRAERAALRREVIARKQRELAAQQQADAARAAAAPAARPAATPAPLVVRPAPAALAASDARAAGGAVVEPVDTDRAGTAATPDARAAAAAERAAAAREREARARAAQQRVQQRQAEREARGRPSAPLPLPPAAAASGASAPR